MMWTTIAAGAGALPMPPQDPLGYPAPAVLLQALSYLTLTLHLLAMSFTLGGLLLLLYARIKKNSVASEFLSTGLPLGFSYLVTFGIPPLLFVQVLYGQMFYSSSVLVGAFWIAVVPLLILAYSMIYTHKLTRRSRPSIQLGILIVAALAMMSVGFIYVNNLTLSMTPERWLGLYAVHPGGGTLNLGEPTILPRFLTFITPIFAVAGAALIIAAGVRRGWKDDEEARSAQRLGIVAFVIGRVAMAGAAAWLLATLPQQLREGVLAGGAKTLLLGTGVGLAVMASLLILVGARRADARLSIPGAVLMAGELGAFVALRDLVRLDYLGGAFRLEDGLVHEQWGMFTLFAAVLVLGLVFLLFATLKVAAGLTKRAREQLSVAPR